MDSELSGQDIENLKNLVPLFTLSEERLRELAALSHMRDHAAGTHIFREGDVDNQTLYLLNGQVQLHRTSGNLEEVIAAGTPEAKHPLGDHQPRQTSALALTDTTILHIDNNVLDYMITWDQVASLAQAPAGVSEEPGSSHDIQEFRWMNKMLSAVPFQNIPSANMHDLLERMEQVPVKKGDIIVRQGEPGDYYYLVESGKAKVTQQVELAQLGEGASFGEEALISDSVRNATVTMESDGLLLRLSKQHFNEMLKEPLIHWVTLDDALNKVKQGAIWLDVRLAREFAHYHLANACNIPLNELRQRMDELDKDTTYICYCKTGRRSSAASFLLSQAGFKVFVLRGGMQILPKVMKLAV
jgi:CRP-like cAMP-binding protein